jgi:dTDP-4-amino-4,6-dideoxygalactose transaminase
MDAAIARVLQSCAFAGGPEVEAFEKAFAAYCDTRFCSAVSTGTAALELALRALRVGPGDEVIVPVNTFFATAEAVSLVGALPVFVDVEESTALIDPACIRSAITSKTKTIIPVHLYGQMARMDEIMDLAREHSLFVIEDCCQAHGARYKGKRAGSYGHAAAFSFYPGKNLGAYGEGGAVVTNDTDIDAFIRLFRDHGSKVKYEHDIVGRNDRLDGIQGAILSAKLPHLDAWNDRRRHHADSYRRLLSNTKNVRCFEERAEGEPVYHLFVVQVPSRDEVRRRMVERGIGVAVHYPVPLHKLTAYRQAHAHVHCPVAEKLAGEILSLPLYPELTMAQIEQVVTALGTCL